MIVSKEYFNILKWLASQGVEYTKRYRGIYTLHGISFLKVQIVITEEIDGELFQWLSSLTDKLTEEKARKLVTTAYHLTENEDKRLAEAIVRVLASANEELFKKMKDDTMASALMELMKPEVEKYAQEYADEEKMKLMVKCYISGALSENTAAEMVDMTKEQFLEYVEQHKEKK